MFVVTLKPHQDMTLLGHLQQSAARDPFRAAVARFVETGRPNDLVRFHGHNPPVKVERTLTRLLESYPTLAVEEVRIEATSGCEFFRGEAVVLAEGEERRVRFHWDCKWRAMEEGWTDYFGFPDQARAAREFGHDCFRVWQEALAPEMEKR